MFFGHMIATIYRPRCLDQTLRIMVVILGSLDKVVV